MTKNKKENRHPLFGTSLKNWLILLYKNGGVEKPYILRGIFITFFIIVFTPARILFRIVYEGRISKTKIEKPPVFIIGHWRSGTTYLHELISNDPQFAYVSLWYTIVPKSFLVLTGLKKFFSKFLPIKRPMDDIKVDMDSPYEEEAALCALLPWSFFHCFIFPRNAEEQFNKSILFKDMSKKDIEHWKKNYLHLVKAVTYSNSGKQLLLKNPANTPRIKLLLELFPDARFIFIYRNPYNVYVSTKKLRNRVLGPFALQNTTPEEVNKHVISNYVDLMNSYYEQKDLISKGHLVEISYENLVKNPLKQVEYIYNELGLLGFEKAKGAISRHIESQKDYKKNIYKFDKETIELVDKNWGFAVKKWDYRHP